jgi:hypothetical protein
MRFWTPDFAGILDKEVDGYTFPDQPSELKDLLIELAERERLKRGLDRLIDEEFEIEVRPDIETLDILSRTATRSQILCYNLELSEITYELAQSGQTEQVLPQVLDLFSAAEPYNEGRENQHF